MVEKISCHVNFKKKLTKCMYKDVTICNCELCFVDAFVYNDNEN